MGAGAVLDRSYRPPVVLLALLIFSISCHRRYTTDCWFDQHVPLNRTTTDTAYGYPYPSTYPWDEMVTIGEANMIPRKRAGSPAPLWTLISESAAEVYRLDAFPYEFTVALSDTTATVDIVMVICTESRPYRCPEPHDRLEKKAAKRRLSARETAVFRNKIERSRFWQTCMNGIQPGPMDDGYSWRMEGVRDSVYSVVWQCVPSEYNKGLYSVGTWPIDLAAAEGLGAKEPWD